jgi:hypothetical protein
LPNIIDDLDTAAHRADKDPKQEENRRSNFCLSNIGQSEVDLQSNRIGFLKVATETTLKQVCRTMAGSAFYQIKKGKKKKGRTGD